ncbi:unnamed protein product [Chrysoparadoxa australica]
MLETARDAQASVHALFIEPSWRPVLHTIRLDSLTLGVGQDAMLVRLYDAIEETVTHLLRLVEVSEGQGWACRHDYPFGKQAYGLVPTGRLPSKSLAMSGWQVTKGILQAGQPTVWSEPHPAIYELQPPPHSEVCATHDKAWNQVGAGRWEHLPFLPHLRTLSSLIKQASHPLLFSCLVSSRQYSVVFIDHGTHHKRAREAARLLPLTQLMVLHDTESHEYRWHLLGEDWPAVVGSQFGVQSITTPLGILPWATMLQGGAPGAEEAFTRALEIYKPFVEESPGDDANTTLKVREAMASVGQHMANNGVPDSSDSEEGYGSHLPLLLSATLATDGHVLELGCGYYSTVPLHHLLEAELQVGGKARRLVTAETSMSWLNKFAYLKADWHQLLPVHVYDDGEHCSWSPLQEIQSEPSKHLSAEL